MIDAFTLMAMFRTPSDSNLHVIGNTRTIVCDYFKTTCKDGNTNCRSAKQALKLADIVYDTSVVTEVERVYECRYDCMPRQREAA